MSIRRGLTLGKYAPLHVGHQFVIETALGEVDEVVVLIYDSPAVTDVPLVRRANWIRQIYPDVRVIEAWGGPQEVGYTADIKKRHEDYILNLLDRLLITHFYSSEPYGEHMSEALGAINRIVDLDREVQPISATMIRENLQAYHQFLHPIVYQDLLAWEHSSEAT
ncbi:MAG: adenylyltransferase/cytidyltransferase family protein [Anaerolineae bacterium]